MGADRQNMRSWSNDGELPVRDVRLCIDTAKRAAKIGFTEYHPGTGRIIWDERLREWWGVSADEPITVEVFLSGLHPDDRAPTMARLDSAMDPQGTGQYFAEYRVINRLDGSERWVASNGQMVFENGQPHLLIGAIADITQRKQAESALHESEQLLLLALEASEMGVWSTSPETGEATANPQARELLGLPPDPPLDVAAMEATVHPEDRAKVAAILHRSRMQGTLFDTRLRIPQPDGAMRWLSIRGRWVPATTGRSGRIIGVLVDVTSQVHQMTALRIAKAEAEKAVRARSQFFAAASHDLRQPFQAMRLFFELLTQSPRDDQRPALERMGQAIRSAEDLLNHFLDVARLEGGAISVQPVAVDVRGVIGEVLMELEPLAAHKGLALRACGAPAEICVDPAILKQVLFNLVNNAIKYTENGGVLVGVRRRSELIIVEIWDTGIGIAEDHSQWIFDDFFQVDNPGRDRAKGLGLGLAIVKRLCDLLGGSVAFASRPGRGTVFRVALPVPLGPVEK